MKRNSLLIGFLLVFVTFYSQAQNIQEGQYYYSKTVNGTLDEVTENVKEVLKEQGFGIVTELDMHKTLNEKLDLNLKGYRLLGACNPGYAHKTMQKEENIGLFLPCKVLLKEKEGNSVEVVAVDPSKLMQMLGNKELDPIAKEVTILFKKAMEQL
jgi:uncharacterized protein (DUF302 family)